MKLIVENLALSRGGQQIVSGISFELTAGEALVVTGENGSGKSTTLRGVAGLLPLDHGQVCLFDETGKQFEEPVREYCHYLGHKNALKQNLTVRENLTFWQDFMGDTLLSVEEALEEVNLSHTIDLPSNYLSTGQKRRVAIAKLLVSDRPIWILDEPTSGLDAQSVDMFSHHIKAFCEDGGILIVATHLPLGLKDTKTLKIGTEPL
ncbi:MAG: heme ABC exporter ATP-binding protein CcmA [Pseudomonadota bacterium]